MKRFYSIDVMKIVAAFMVICIHLPFPGVVSEIIGPLTTIAVPYFFMVSGFFLWDTNKKRIEEKTIKSIKKTLIYLFTANLLYFVWGLLLSLVSDNRTIMEYLISSFSINSTLKFILLNQSPFGVHLWYLSAYLYVLVIYYFAVKFGKTKQVIMLAPFLLIGNLILGKYSLILFNADPMLLLSRNFITVGLPYFFIGCYFRRKYSQNKLKINNFILITVILLFSITTILERFILEINKLNAEGDLYANTTFLVILIFIKLINNPNLFRNTWLLKLNPHTLNIYIIHPMFITIYIVIISVLPYSLESVLIGIGPISILGISYLASYVYTKSIKKFRTSKYFTKNIKQFKPKL